MSTTIVDKQERDEQVIPPKSNRSKRRGKGSQAKSTEAYRNRRNEQQMAAFHASIEEKYSLFQADEGSLKAAMESVVITPQPVAVPLSVTTRGVGLAVATTYDRTCTTWNVEAISAIATIHQVYRVALLCSHLKVYLAQQIQVESVSVGGAFRRITLLDEIRELVYQISQVPATLALVLDCIGKIEHEGAIWHMGYPDVTLCESSEWRYLTICPDTIRDTLLWLANPETPAAERLQFIAHNPIPGAHFVEGLLQNPDEIWPQNYEANGVRTDIHAFKNWITRVETRLPKHSFPKISWSGLASSGGLVSSEGSSFRLEARFISVSRRAIDTTKTVRDASGKRRLVPPSQPVSHHFYGIQPICSRSDFWEPGRLKQINQVMGAASLVGEVCCIETRHESNARERFTVDPVTIVMSVGDAPR